MFREAINTALYDISIDLPFVFGASFASKQPPAAGCFSPDQFL
jgi:hypothetical protein